MAPYEQKTDSKEFELADPAQFRRSPGADARADVTTIAIRLWSSQGSARSVPLSWATDSVLIYMIADLVRASSGHLAEESPEPLAAHFGTCRQAVVAARRIQTSILEFLACRPGDRVGGAILIYHVATGFSGDTVRRALGQAKPGQILLAENISQRLHELPGIEVRDVPPMAGSPADDENGWKELVWTTPDRVALLQTSAGDDVPLLGATVIVPAPFARRAEQAVPPATAKGESGSKNDSEGRSRQASPVAQDVHRRGAASEEFPESSNNSSALSIEEFVQPPLFTRTRVILGVVALVLAVSLIAVLNRPVHVARPPIPARQDQTVATEAPEQQAPVKTEPEAAMPQSESKIVKTEIVKPPVVKPPIIKSTSKPAAAPQQQIPERAFVDNRVKKDIPETTSSYNDESGGVSQKDIPALLRMAQADAGAGNYDKARTEFRKILGLQPGNQDAREGLHKLDIIQKDQP